MFYMGGLSMCLCVREQGEFNKSKCCTKLRSEIRSYIRRSSSKC